jgi:hypothetical protein
MKQRYWVQVFASVDRWSWFAMLSKCEPVVFSALNYLKLKRKVKLVGDEIVNDAAQDQHKQNK